MSNFARTSAGRCAPGLLLGAVLLLGAGASAARAQGLPELEPCSPQAAAEWQNNAFRKSVASAQSIESTHGRIGGDGGENPGIEGLSQSENAKNKKNQEEDFSEDDDSCWSQVGDRLGGTLKGILDGISGGLGDIFGGLRWPDLEEINISDVLCSATLRAESVLAGGIYTAARMPRILTDAMVRRVRWKARSYENHAAWERRRLERLPERRARARIREWGHSADLPVRVPWGAPPTWPRSWNQD